MEWLFWKKHGAHPSKKLDTIGAAASETHKKNIQKIIKARKDAGKSIVELKRNNITLELAKAIGH
jgi:hypothetical protein